MNNEIKKQHRKTKRTETDRQGGVQADLSVVRMLGFLLYFKNVDPLLHAFQLTFFQFFSFCFCALLPILVMRISQQTLA